LLNIIITEGGAEKIGKIGKYFIVVWAIIKSGA